jgi:hypothetical protein
MAQILSNLQTDVPAFDPNTEQVRVGFEASEDGFATLIISHANGGWVLSLGEIRVREGANTLVWQGHDLDGWPLAAGHYALELFGYGRDRRPTGTTALRLTLELIHHPPSAMLPSVSPVRAFTWDRRRTPVPVPPFGGDDRRAHG